MCADLIQLPNHPNKLNICLPNNVSAGTIRDIVLRALTERPQWRADSAAFIIIGALAVAFPCRNRADDGGDGRGW
jgi:hypothetical protein